MKYWKGNNLEKLKENQIFVFGSNPSGNHGAGAAKAAMKFGAWYGEGRGLYGQTYALVTKNLKRNYEEQKTGIIYSRIGAKSVSPEQIKKNIQEMYNVAREMPEKEFLITYKHELDNNKIPKKSLNGYTSIEMLDMFLEKEDIPENVVFHESYKPLIEKKINKKNNLIKEKPSVFSSSYPSSFKYKEINFISVNHFILYAKAKMFKDEESANKIMKLSKSGIAKSFISGELSDYEILNNKINLDAWNNINEKMNECKIEKEKKKEEEWKKKKISIMSVGNREKFAQNKKLEKELMSMNESIEINFVDCEKDKIEMASILMRLRDSIKSNNDKLKKKNKTRLT